MGKHVVYDFTVDTPVSPERMLAAATDFSERRPDLWPLITRKHYRVFSVAGGLVLVALGLLLFFDEFWRLQVYVHRALDAIGLGDL